MINLLQEPKTLLFSILGGIIPAILWLWFWFKEEDNENPEPFFLVALSFIIGGILVFVAISLEKYSLNFTGNETQKIIVWAAIEEILKLIGVTLILSNGKIIKEPIDYPMYFIAVALGFAAMENFLYLLNPISTEGTVVGLITGNLRFLGSTLLHAIASSMIGSALGFAFYLEKRKKRYLILGLLFAIILHSIFNFFIMESSSDKILSVFAFLWVVTIINILIFEKLKRMRKIKIFPVS